MCDRPYEGRTLVVLGSMDEFVALVKLAQGMGAHVIVCDGYANGPAKPIADEAYTIDIRDTNAIAQLCQDHKADAIVTAYSDLLAECQSAIATKAGLRTPLPPERLRFLRDKTLMKQMFSELGIPYPKSVEVHRATAATDLAKVGFPCVIKPTDAYGSHGVYLLDSVDEVMERFDDTAFYSDSDVIVAEAYDDGHEFNMMSWIVDGEPHVLSIEDREKSHEIEHVTPHVSRIVYPSRLTDVVENEATKILSEVAHYVGLQNGPLCMQFFWSRERGVQVCECAGRIFGYEHELLQLSSNNEVSIERLLLAWAFEPESMASILRNHSSHLPRCAAGLYFHGYEGVVSKIQGLPQTGDPGVADVLRYYAPGDVISHAVGAKPYVARVYLVGDTRQEVDEATLRIFRSAKVLDSDGRNLLYNSEIGTYEDAR